MKIIRLITFVIFAISLIWFLNHQELFDGVMTLLFAMIVIRDEIFSKMEERK
jgi:hypothetical protein